jgi:hypothetical protein
MLIRKSAVGICAVVFAATIGASAWRTLPKTSAQTMPPSLQKLTVLSGTWKATGKTYATDFSKEGADNSTLHNDCWQSGMFYACDQIVDGDSKALIVFTPGAKDGTFVNYGIAPPNPANAGRLVIEGNKWTYGGVIEGEKAPYWRTLNTFDTANGTTTIHYTVQFSKDGTNWITMKDGIETKQP